VAVTAAGEPIGERELRRGHVQLNEKDLAPLLTAFRALPDHKRMPPLPDPAKAQSARRPVPEAPEGGLVIRGFCTYMKTNKSGKPERARRLYYERNPGAWAAETQSDTLWLTEQEWRSLIPDKLEPGVRIQVAKEIQRRFFSTIGIDYMEGSVNALPVEDSKMTLAVEKKLAGAVTVLKLEGYGIMGKAPDESTNSQPRTRGCELRVVGRITYDPAKKKITAFDLAGVGEAWGNKLQNVRREIGLPNERWNYGIACEIVNGTSPYDRIPPYNMFHYGGKIKYFGD